MKRFEFPLFSLLFSPTPLPLLLRLLEYYTLALFSVGVGILMYKWRNCLQNNEYLLANWKKSRKDDTNEILNFKTC